MENIDETDLPEPYAEVTFRPAVAISADIDAVFETSVGVIHRIRKQPTIVVHADRGRPSVADGNLTSLVEDNLHATVELDPERFEDDFDELEERRFGQTETEYKDWAVDSLRERYTTTVTYTGDNNVTYTKRCEPNLSDISVQAIEPVYVPEVRQTTDLQAYSYPYQYFAAGPSRVTVEDGIHRCVHCDEHGSGETYTYCANCGAIACAGHTKTERLEGTPICTGCAVTERFAWKTKYFYDEENLEEFRREYEQMPIHQKAMENTYLVAGILGMGVLFVLGVLASLGMI